MYKQGITKDATNVDQTNDAMVEYVRVLLGSVASKTISTLMRPVNTFKENPKRKYRLVAPLAIEGGISVVTEVTDKYKAHSSKNDLVVDADNWRLTMNLYMKEYNNHIGDERQWKVEDGKKSTILCSSTAITGSRKS
jgi:hypothetical protein